MLIARFWYNNIILPVQKKDTHTLQPWPWEKLSYTNIVSAPGGQPFLPELRIIIIDYSIQLALASWWHGCLGPSVNMSYSHGFHPSIRKESLGQFFGVRYIMALIDVQVDVSFGRCCQSITRPFSSLWVGKVASADLDSGYWTQLLTAQDGGDAVITAGVILPVKRLLQLGVVLFKAHQHMLHDASNHPAVLATVFNNVD